MMTVDDRMSTHPDAPCLAAPGCAEKDVCGPSRSLRVFLFITSETARGWMREVLKTEEGIQVVGEACDAGSAIPLIRMLEPDAVILDSLRREQRLPKTYRDLKRIAAKPKFIMVVSEVHRIHNRDVARTGVDAVIERRSEWDAIPGILKQLVAPEC